MRSVRKTLMAMTLFSPLVSGAVWASGSRPCPDPGAQSLVGLWESSNVSKGGIGQALELRENGMFVQSTTVMVNSRYEISGDRLTVHTESPGPGETMEFTFLLTNNRLIETMKSGPPMPKERVGPAATGERSIVGVWRSGDSTGMVGYEKYTPDGRMLFRLTMQASTGCYRIEGDRIRLSGTNGRKTPALPFHRTTGELVLDDGHGKPYTYQLAVDGPWYDRHPVSLKGMGANGMPGASTNPFPGGPGNGG
jgi:hypothetical protein